MSLLEEVTKLVEDIIPFIDSEVMGDEKAQALSEQLGKVKKELESPKILGDVERKIVTSFDDWEERVYGMVEFVRGNTITQFKIQSLTASEQKEIRQKRDKARPVVPTPRSRGDKIDTDDPHYKKDMLKYDEDMRALDELNMLWVLEKGFVNIDIPGKDDQEKLAFLNSKVAGDAPKIAGEIVDLSNLTPENLSPFSRG